MSGSPKNVQRDGTYLDIDVLSYTYSVSSDTGAITSSGPSAVNVDFVEIQAWEQLTLTAAQQGCVGVQMDGPIKDRQPYRVKASVKVEGVVGDAKGCYIVVGYGPASPSGTDDAVTGAKYIPFESVYDDLIILYGS